MSVPALFGALLRRELTSRASAQRMIVVVAVGVLSGFLAGGVAPSRPPGRPGALENALASYEHLSGWIIGMLAGLRCIATQHDDQRRGWLTQLFAFGVRRDAYLAQLAAATLLAGWVDYGLALGSFAAVHAAAAGTAPLGRMLGVLPGALLWTGAVMALAAACGVVLNERTRARFSLAALLLLPYVGVFLYAFMNDDRPPPRAVIVLVGWVVPRWLVAPTLVAAGQLLLYTSLALILALLLAPARIERSS